MSEAALDGIIKYGSKWQATIYLGHNIEKLAYFNNLARNGEPIDDSDVEVVALDIVKRVRRFVERHPEFQDTDLHYCSHRLEEVADCGISEITDEMNRLYDAFDYYRVLATK